MVLQLQHPLHMYQWHLVFYYNKEPFFIYLWSIYRSTIISLFLFLSNEYGVTVSHFFLMVYNLFLLSLIILALKLSLIWPVGTHSCCNSVFMKVLQYYKRRAVCSFLLLSWGTIWRWWPPDAEIAPTLGTRRWQACSPSLPDPGLALLCGLRHAPHVSGPVSPGKRRTTSWLLREDKIRQRDSCD